MTPDEKAKKAIAEGFEWLASYISMKLGENDRRGYEVVIAAAAARTAMWKARDAYARFVALVEGRERDERDERDDGPQLRLPATRAAELAEPKRDCAKCGSCPGPTEPQAPEEDEEIERVAGELGAELDRILGPSGMQSMLIHVDVGRAADRVVYATIGADGSDAEGTTAWEIHRDADRVLAALRTIGDGLGAEAVRTTLCGLEPEAAEPPSADDQVEADIVATEAAIGAELTRCGADGVEARCALGDAGVMEASLIGGDWSLDTRAAEVIDALKALPNDCGEAEVKQRLLTETDGGTATPPSSETEQAGVTPAKQIKVIRSRLDALGCDTIEVFLLDGSLADLRKHNGTGVQSFALAPVDALGTLHWLEPGTDTESVWQALSDTWQRTVAVANRERIARSRDQAEASEQPGRPAGEAPSRKRRAKKAEVANETA